MTQQALASAAGLDRSFLAEVEAGKHGIAVDRVYLLADALGVPITSLITEDDQR